MAGSTIVQRKVCMLGHFAVGKTSLVRRFVEGRFDDKYLTTIGVKISRKPVTVAGTPVHLILWDLAGSEEYNGVQTSYLQGASGGLVVCDLTRPETLEGWSHYVRRLREVNPAARVVLVANKADLQDQRAISDDELRQAAAMLDDGTGSTAQYWLTSAKTGEYVEEAFHRLAALLLGPPV
ncbi:MAG: Rab family GTPase [Anaerolineae bacterium]